MIVKWHTLWNGLIYGRINIHQSIGGIERWCWCTDMWEVISNREVQVQLAPWQTSTLQPLSWLTRTHCCGNQWETPPWDWHANFIAILTSHYTPGMSYSPSPSQAWCVAEADPRVASVQSWPTLAQWDIKTPFGSSCRHLKHTHKMSSLNDHACWSGSY